MIISSISNNLVPGIPEVEKKVPQKKSKLSQIMAMDKDFRSHADVEFLYKELKHLEYFKHLFERNEDLILSNVLKFMAFREYKKHDIIYRHGEMGTHCYILIKGNVEFVLPQNKILIQNSISNIINKGFGGMFGNLKKLAAGKSEGEPNKNHVKKGEMSVISVTHEGNIFGEKELAERIKHSYTARCQTNCLIGELTKTEYIQIFENTKRLEYNEEIKFYYSINILKDCQKIIIDKLMAMFEKKHCKKGEIICRQNSDFDHLYLIRRGDFEVVYTNKKNFTSDFDINFFLKLNDNNERFTSNRVFELKESYNKYDNFKLVILGYGEFFGDIEIKNNYSKYCASLVCNMDKSEIYQCDKSKFLAQMPDSFLSKVCDNARDREKYYRARIDGIRKNTFKTNLNKYQTTFIKKNSQKKKERSVYNGRGCFDSDSDEEEEMKIKKTNHKNNFSFTKNINKIPSPKSPLSQKMKFKKDKSFNTITSNNLILRNIVTPKSALYRQKSTTYSINTLSTADTNYLQSSTENKFRIQSAFPLATQESMKNTSKAIIPRIQTAQVKSQSTTNKNKNNFILQIEDPFNVSQISKFNNVINKNKKKEPFAIKNRSILFENSKDKYAKCFELNKKFFLENNPSILSTNLENVFVACKVPKKKNKI